MARWVLCLLTLLLTICPAMALRADANGDGRVDLQDLAILAEEWLMADKVVRFSGGYMTVGNDAPLRVGTGSFTICMWIATKSDAFGLYARFFYEYGTAFRYFNGRLRFEGLGWPQSEPGIEGPSYAMQFEGAWTHLAAVVDKTAMTCTLYVNAVAVATSTVNDRAIDTPYGARIGRDNLNFTLGGYMEDFRLYKAALTAGEIAAIYNNGNGVAYNASQTPVSGAASFVLDFNDDFDAAGKLYDLITGVAATRVGEVSLVHGAVPNVPVEKNFGLLTVRTAAGNARTMCGDGRTLLD